MRGSTAEVVAEVRAWLAADVEPEPLIVETSGSTGLPKRVLLSRRAMVASATGAHDRLGGPGSWLLTLPASYVAGLQVVVRSLLAGHEPTEADDDLAAAVERMPAGRRYLSLVPTQLHRLLADERQAPAIATLDAVLLGGGPIDPALRARAEAAGVAVVATYGASETAGGCVYDGVPLDGVELATDDDGRIRIRGPVLFDGYDGDPRLTAEALVDGWFVTADVGTVEDGRLRVLGRVDDVVVSGGVNVPTPAVARRLRQHPAVEQAEVIGVPDDEWGHRVVAVVVGDLGLDEARDWVAAELPRTWAPRDLVAVDALPMLGTGKVDRLRLKELA
ncbi:DUF3156 family protein [Nocardioides guangzhouensis]|uniref:DUF3156 family protein n=1 Tax=Nocardioides guangzhouensis TaxID=2497878 RepID=A0A4Q4Z0T9_9ACTN|nr:DUF3156 family protein [Nocardioides guangzhouensis]